MVTRRRSMASRPRRKRVWGREVATGSISAGGVTHFDLLSEFYARLGSGIPGATVGRCRMSFAWETTSTPDPLDNLVVGILVDGSTADAVDHDPGVVIGGMHLDWMYWSKLYPSLQPSQTAAAVLGHAQWDIDVKAQRRMEEIDQTLWFVVSCTNSALLAGEASYGVSTLVVLP